MRLVVPTLFASKTTIWLPIGSSPALLASTTFSSPGMSVWTGLSNRQSVAEPGASESSETPGRHSSLEPWAVAGDTIATANASITRTETTPIETATTNAVARGIKSRRAGIELPLTTRDGSQYGATQAASPAID